MVMMSFRCLRSRLGEAGVGAMVNGRGGVGVMVMLDWRVSASLFPVFLFFVPFDLVGQISSRQSPNPVPPPTHSIPRPPFPEVIPPSQLKPSTDFLAL